MRRADTVAAIIPAGGLGVRFGSRIPKQFLRLGRLSVLGAAARPFMTHPQMTGVVVAAPVQHVERARKLLRPFARRVPLTVVAGGASRQESVWRALQAIPDASLIVVHDAVRPFIERALIDAVLRTAREYGAAVCGVPISDTLKRVSGDRVETTIDRAGLWAVQTPQAFRGDLLREAHEKARRDGFEGTDDAMLVERLGHVVRMVLGNAGNVKITRPADLRRTREARWR